MNNIFIVRHVGHAVAHTLLLSNEAAVSMETGGLNKTCGPGHASRREEIK